MANQAPLADQPALAKLGETVRQRLGGDPGVYRIPANKAEIFAVGDFLDEEECARLIARIDEVARPSSTYDEQHQEQYRTSYSGDFDKTDSFFRMFERRIADLLGIPEAWGETAQGQRYAPGQEFKGHYDWFNTSAFYWPKEVERGGQRSWTAMAYLNDVEEGGETEFAKLGMAVVPKRGSLLVWNNATREGTPNRYVFHAAKPVVRGVKYVITKWFRTKPWK